MRKKFKPKPGQIDFTNARYAPVINCIVKFCDKILLVKRSRELNFYPGHWNGISGFLDDKRSWQEKVKDELKEELGIGAGQILKMRLGQIFHTEDRQYQKTWIVHPVLVEIKTNKIKLNWEAEDHKWLKPKKIQKLNLVPGFEKVLKNLFG